MTTRLTMEPDTMADQFLRLLGKERAYIVPSGQERVVGTDVYTMTRKESVLSCILRNGNDKLPQGYITKKRLEELINGMG